MIIEAGKSEIFMMEEPMFQFKSCQALRVNVVDEIQRQIAGEFSLT